MPWTCPLCPAPGETAVDWSALTRRLMRLRDGKKVTSRKQAIAIGLSEARKAGGKVPRKAASSRH